jgi:hypothetical protein
MAARSKCPHNSIALTCSEFPQLADVPPEVEWFANVTNGPTRTRTAAPPYQRLIYGISFRWP